jgi:hypothetical protein
MSMAASTDSAANEVLDGVLDRHHLRHFLGSGGSAEDLRSTRWMGVPSMVLRYTKATKTERALRGQPPAFASG